MNPFAAKPGVTAEESALFSSYFKSLTSTNLAPVDAVVKFLSSSNLPQSQLAEVWEVAGGAVRGNGLVEEEFIVACKLVALLQNQLLAKKENLGMKTPLPIFKEVNPSPLVPQRTGQSQPLVPQRTGQSQPLVPQRTGQSDISKTQTISSSTMVCTPEEKSRFTGFFQVSGPVDGFLPGTVAKDIFMKSGLSNDVLGKVWALVDKDGKGKFSVDMFVAAMWIITKIKMGGMTNVPETMPAGLWNSITGVPEKLVSLPNSVASSPVLKNLSLPTTSTSSQFSSYTADLSDAERTQYQGYFDSIDTTKKGVLNGQECFPVFLKSNLPQAELGQIWELVDTTKSGSISKDGFIAAMHLIKKRIGGAPIPSNAQTSSLLDFNTTAIPSPAAPTPAPKMPTEDLLRGLSIAPPPSVSSSVISSNNILNPTAPPSFTSMPAQPGSQAPMMNILSLEAKEVAIREQQLNARQSEVASLTQQLLDLKPSADDLKKKREQIDADYKKANEKRSQLSVELVQLRAEYELGLETLKDRQEMLARDLHALQVANTELEQYKDAISLIKKETQSLQEKIDKQKSQLVEMQAQVTKYAEETAKAREANQKIFEESRAQQQQYDVLEKMVESGKDEHRIVKENMELEGNRLEQEKKKYVTLEQQVSVQAAIIERERLKAGEMEKERKELEVKNQELEIKNQELIATEARMKEKAKEQEANKKELIAAQMEKERKMADLKATEAKDLLATAVAHSEVVIPENEPPPPVPSLSKKPTQSSKENIAEAIVKESSSPMSALSAPAAVQGKQTLKNEKDSLDLDNLMQGNKPKSNSHDEKRPAVSATPDFESFFASAAPAQPLVSQETQKKSSGEDIKKAMEMAFANTTLKAAKDTPSLGSSSTIKRAAIPTEQFKFDSSFAAPQPLKTISPASSKKITAFGNFDDANFSGFKQQANASPQDLDSVFGGASIPAPTGFTNDPFGGPNAFVNAATNGNNQKSTAPNFGSDPFGAADFGSSFPAPTAVSRTPSPIKGDDTPEVVSITSMGFTREQAVNALEIHGQDVQKAINYLLESTAK